MLVTGEGKPVPYTSDFVWPVQNVLAVFEVKKNLYGADLDDAFQKLRAINDMFGAYVNSAQPKFDVSPSFTAFARLTGLYPRNRKELARLPEEVRYFYHLLVTEQIGPIRVILGYEGYVDESGLRAGFSAYLEQNKATPRGFGLGSFPKPVAVGGSRERGVVAVGTSQQTISRRLRCQGSVHARSARHCQSACKFDPSVVW